MAKEQKNKMPKEKLNNKDKRKFFKDFKAELKKVIWLTPKQLLNNTVAVISIVLFTAVIVLLLNLVFEAGNKYGVSNLRKTVQKSFVIDQNNTNIVQNTIENLNSVNESNIVSNTVQ